jgi:hypothetical protein
VVGRGTWSLVTFVGFAFIFKQLKVSGRQHMIESGLFSYREVDVHLSYVLGLISGGLDRVSPQVTKAIASYIAHYDFGAVEKLIACRIELHKSERPHVG